MRIWRGDLYFVGGRQWLWYGKKLSELEECTHPRTSSETGLGHVKVTNCWDLSSLFRGPHDPFIRLFLVHPILMWWMWKNMGISQTIFIFAVIVSQARVECNLKNGRGNICWAKYLHWCSQFFSLELINIFGSKNKGGIMNELNWAASLFSLSFSEETHLLLFYCPRDRVSWLLSLSSIRRKEESRKGTLTNNVSYLVLYS